MCVCVCVCVCLQYVPVCVCECVCVCSGRGIVERLVGGTLLEISITFKGLKLLSTSLGKLTSALLIESELYIKKGQSRYSLGCQEMTVKSPCGTSAISH